MDASGNFDPLVRLGFGVETSPDTQFTSVGMSDARDSKPTTIACSEDESWRGGLKLVLMTSHWSLLQFPIRTQ